MAEQNNQVQSKLDAFAQTIQNAVDAERFAITGEVEDYHSREITKYLEDVRANFLHFAEREIAALESDEVNRIGTHKQELKKCLFARRAQFEDEIFADVKADIAAFVAGPNYGDFMRTKAKKIAKNLSVNGCNLLVRAEDLPLAEELTGLFNSATANVDNNIKLGGLIVENRAAGVRTDESLDTILKRQQEWFHANSGLVITL